ncbi:MAG TPA: ABC transporter ATP-binding protein [Micropruina sp.]|nr:ABC transporter ATP-binding protein [Micropruina sp.]
MMSALVRLDAVSKLYSLGDGSVLRAADAVTIEIAEGTRTALVGASGSGKSTLLHLMGAVDVPDEGRIVVDGTDITSLNRRRLADYRAGVGFVFQQFHLLPALTVLDNVAAPLVGRCSGTERKKRSLEMLEAVGLADRATAYPEQLSGGQQQRVAIARSLVVRPSLLLADEPTGNLDSTTAAQIVRLLSEVQERYSVTMVIATHDGGIAASCDDVLEVRDGRVRRSETPVDA